MNFFHIYDAFISHCRYSLSFLKKKKKSVTQYFVNRGVPIFWLDFTPLWPIVLHCINFAVARY